MEKAFAGSIFDNSAPAKLRVTGEANKRLRAPRASSYGRTDDDGLRRVGSAGWGLRCSTRVLNMYWTCREAWGDDLAV